MNRKVLLIVAFLLAPALIAGQVTTSQLGYHPDQDKRVVAYTNHSQGVFEIRSDDSVSYTANLTPSTCQGGQACLLGDFSNLTAPGVYTAHAHNTTSQPFRIHEDVYADALEIFAEVFNALRLQDSSYHPDHHAAADPPLPMTADGSFLLTTHQAALTVVRLGQAYETNPQALGFSVYEERPDLAVHIKQYVDFLAALQDHDGTRSVPKGWFYDFNCAKDYTLDVGQHNDEQDECLLWDPNSDSESTVHALTAYAHALPAITAVYGEEEGELLLARALETDAYIQETHSIVVSPGKFGAALFILYDFTQEPDYLERAYALRDQVGTSLDAEWTAGEELYWNEYIRHEAAIQEIGPYEIGGQDPRVFFTERTQDNWEQMSVIGDRALSAQGRNFQNSRPMLLAAVQAEFSEQHADTPNATRVSESQIAWLTGQNRVDWWYQGMRSRSFIFGIGENGVNQHTRFVQPSFFEEGQQWLNGKTHIDGWIVGAYDNSGDGLLEYDDRYDAWEFTESTNHLASLGVLAFAQLDARYNDQQPLARPLLGWEAPVLNDTNTTGPDPDACYQTLRSLPSTCMGGEIVTDATDGCRQVVCEGSNGSIEVQACDKPAGQAQYFELTRESVSGQPPELCLADVCMQEETFLRSGDYPICPLADEEPKDSVSLDVVWSAPAQAVLGEEINSSLTITNTGNVSFSGSLSYYFNASARTASGLSNMSLSPGADRMVTLSLVTTPAGTFVHSIRSANGSVIYAEHELTVTAQEEEQEEPEETAPPSNGGGGSGGGSGGGGGFLTGVATEFSSEENTSSAQRPAANQSQPTQTNASEDGLNERQEDVNESQDFANTSQEGPVDEQSFAGATTRSPPSRNFLTGAVVGTVKDIGVVGWVIAALVLAALAGIILLKKS